MTSLADTLKQLVHAACRYPVGHPQRQKYLTQIIRQVSGKLWHEHTPYYPDALQQTWVYFCQNLCEGKTGDPYDPERSSITTWLNAYLKRRLQDFYIQEQKQRATQAAPRSPSTRSGEWQDSVDPVETLSAEPDVPPILEQVRAWVEADRTGDLRRTYIGDRPDVTCQLLILKRLPPETPWKVLAVELDLPISTLSSFYQRHCLPRLRKFGESEGYL